MVAVASGCGLTGGSQARGGKVLRLHDGGGGSGAATKSALYAPFLKDSGYEAQYVPTAPAAQLRASIESGNPRQDIMDLAAQSVDEFVRADLLVEIDYSDWPAEVRDGYDTFPLTKYAVPSYIYATQLAYDAGLTKYDLTSWADVWGSGYQGKPALGTGDFLPTNLFEIALLADGVPSAELYPLDIDRAFQKLTELRPRLLKFWSSGAESVQLLVDKQASVVSTWNGRVSDAQKAGAKLKATFNQALLNVDYWVIPKGARNVDEIQRLIRSMADPRRQAAYSTAYPYSPPNSGAFAYIDASIAERLPTSSQYAGQTIPINSEFWSSPAPNGGSWSDSIIQRWQKWLTA
jgi:putative spermidine/putrescine transport system substrate-binding protein